MIGFEIRAFNPYLLGMNPMSTFNPDAPCRVHDKLNEKILDWRPEWAANYRQYASEFDAGVINWDGLLLDGWCPA